VQAVKHTNAENARAKALATEEVVAQA